MWGGLKPGTEPQLLFWFALPGNMKADQHLNRLDGMTWGYSISGSPCLKRRMAHAILFCINEAPKQLD